jgi:hypothetical protein
VKRPGHVFVRRRLEELADGLGRQLGGHVARAVSAHAVGHDEQIVFLENDEGVFVVLAL